MLNTHIAAMIVATVGCVTAACLVDLLSAIITARQLGIEIRSARLRYTIEKLSRYLLPLTLMAIIDYLVGLSGLTDTPWCTLLIGLAEVAVEAKSVMEHAVRRRDKTSKMPEQISAIADWIGHERLAAIVNHIIESAKANKEDEKD